MLRPAGIIMATALFQRNLTFVLLSIFLITRVSFAQYNSCNLTYYNSNCIVSNIDPAPAGYVCGTYGHIAHESLIHPPCSENGCREACIENPKCQSFILGYEDQECRLYSKPLDQMGFQPRKLGHGMGSAYNRHCLSQDCSRPNLVPNPGFEGKAPRRDTGAQAKNTWLYSFQNDPGDTFSGQAFVCNRTSEDAYEGTYSLYCNLFHTGTLTVHQYITGLKPNHKYTLDYVLAFLDRRGSVSAENPDPGALSNYTVYADGQLLYSAVECNGDYDSGCGFGYYNPPFGSYPYGTYQDSGELPWTSNGETSHEISFQFYSNGNSCGFCGGGYLGYAYYLDNVVVRDAE